MSISVARILRQNKTNNHNNKKLYIVTKYSYTSEYTLSFHAPYMMQIEKNDVIKSSIVAFVNKTHAVQFAHLLEQYYQRNYIWPQFNIENNIENILFSSKCNDNKEEDLNILYIDTYEYNDIIDYCKHNVFDLLLLEDNTYNSEYDYFHNILPHNNQIMYKVKLYNIESCIEKEKEKCESMYNYIQ